MRDHAKPYCGMPYCAMPGQAGKQQQPSNLWTSTAAATATAAAVHNACRQRCCHDMHS